MQTNNIPHIIHQIWVGPKKAPIEWMDTWKKKHKDWKFMLWDNDAVKQHTFINRDNIRKCIDGGLYHGAADLIRYEVLYEYGGFVAPADSECLNPIDELLDIEEDCFACYQGEIKRPGLVSPHLGTTRGNRLMKAMIDVTTGINIKEPWQQSGNLVLTNMIKKMNYPIRIYPSYYFIPTYNDGEKYSGDGKVYADHKWFTTKHLG